MTTEELIKKLQKDRQKARRRFYSDPDNKKMLQNLDEKHDEFREKTYLYIRATDTDNGSRPLPANVVHWRSPDIELYDSWGNLLPANELNEGQSYYIEVVVNNDGDMSCSSCVVELFICNPSIGFGVQFATQIGIQNVQVLGHNKMAVQFPFTPDAANVGHQCLFARAYSYTSGDMPAAWNTFSPKTDRHVGQQNLCVVEQGDTFEFQVVPFMGGMQQADFNLQITQNMEAATPANRALKIMGLKATRKRIPSKKFTVLKHKETTTVPPMTRVARPVMVTRRPSRGSVFKRFLRVYRPAAPKYDAAVFEKVNAVSKNTWMQTFRDGQNKVTLDLPFMFVSKRKAAVYDIEVTDKETGESLGGITLIVKG